MRVEALGDARFWLMVGALACAIAGAARPHIDSERARVDALFVIDITGSMNVRDYTRDGKPQSRLEFVKGALVRLLPSLPCGSHVGLAVFSERRPFLLLAPLETCANFAPLVRTVSELDWRMAWEGDSHIASGLYGSIELAQSLGADLVFLTDGQESPPLPYGGAPVFEGVPGKLQGVLVGVGGYALAPIPKFDEHGLETGFLAEGDVPQESRVGLPPPGAELRRGYNARNAPYGAEAAHGNEHLSSVREEYLKSLGSKTGLGYAHLADGTDLFEAIARRTPRRHVKVAIELSPWLAACGLLALTGVYVLDPLVKAGRRLRGSRARSRTNSFQSVTF